MVKTFWAIQFGKKRDWFSLFLKSPHEDARVSIENP